MAVVRFSDELQTAIIDNAKALFNPRITKLMDSPPDLGDVVATMVTAEHAPLVSALPREFFPWLQHVSLTIATDRGNRSFELKTKNEYPVPRNWVTNSDGSKYDSGYKIVVKLPNTEKYAHVREQLMQWQSGIDALTQQRDEFVAGVRKLMQAHATLAPALKAWPPLWDLVPDKYKERHRKVVARTKVEEPALDVDLTKMTSTVVASKLIK